MKWLSVLMLFLILFGSLALVYNIRLVKSDYAWTEPIYIRADGSIEPPGAPVSTVDNVTYTLTDNIVDAAPPENLRAITIDRDNIVLDGAGYTLQGTVQSPYVVFESEGIDLSGAT